MKVHSRKLTMKAITDVTMRNFTICLGALYARKHKKYINFRSVLRHLHLLYVSGFQAHIDKRCLKHIITASS